PHPPRSRRSFPTRRSSDLFPRCTACIPLLHGLGRGPWCVPRPVCGYCRFSRPSFVRFCRMGEGRFLVPPASGFRKGGTAMNPNHANRSLRTLTFCALLVAMSIVFSRVLSISTGFLRFNLGSLPVVLAAVLFGPGAGFVVGAVADAIGGVLAGYA